MSNNSIKNSNKKYLGEHFLAALRIVNYRPPDVAASFLYDIHRKHADKLVKCGALKMAPYSQEILVYEGSCKDMDFKDVVSIDGTLCYYSGYGWVEVDEFEVRMYTISFDWLFKNILHGLNASTQHRYSIILEDYVWNFSNIRLKQYKVPLIIARCIIAKNVYRALADYLNKYHSKTPALVLAIEDQLPEYFSLPGDNVCLAMQDTFINDMGKLYFNIDLMLEKMNKDIKQEGFSDGYRSAYFDGKHYTFTKKRAEILELLDNATKPMHQDEILAIVSPNSSNTKINSIFRTNGKYDPAWDVIIKHDSKGNYWLKY